MLFTDSDIVTAADLRAIDYEVAEVAEAAHLTLEGPNSITALAWQDCADELLAQFQQFGGQSLIWGVASPSLGLGWNWPSGTTRAAISLTQIVVVPAIQQWMTFRALSGLFRAARNSSAEDRYQKKQDAYACEAAGAWKTLYRLGLPVVSEPIAAPGAIHDLAAGQFADADVSALASGSRDAQTVAVAITWTNARGVESGSSRIVSFEIPADSLMRVSRAGCTPPAGVTHWNVYVGVDGGALTRQAAALPIASETWDASGAIVASSYRLGVGQLEERRLAFANLWQRG